MTRRMDVTDLAAAVEVLAGGGTVALPTETVYGLAADATRPEAVARVFAAKDRPSFNPLIAHVSDRRMAAAAADFPPEATRLADAFWPGPLTLVLPSRALVCDLARAGLPTIGVRMPDHPLALAVIAALERPVAAPSANPSQGLSPTTADHVLAGLGGRIDAVLDGGPCRIGLESTIVGFVPGPVLLRPGGVPAEALADILGAEVPAAPPGPVTAPGQSPRHYAPRTPLRLDAVAPEPGEAWLGFGPGPDADGPARNLSPRGSLTEAASNLFGHLRALDGSAARIAVAPIPAQGLGVAIRDRLARAAAAP